MDRTIQIDAPGAGAWIMERVAGFFTPERDHSFSAHGSNGQILGGIAACEYLGQTMTMHMAGEGKHWCSRELLWITFDYVFNQVGITKAVGPVRSDNEATLAIDLRGGWFLEAVVKDVYAPGVHMVILSMTRETCPWLNYQPKAWQPGKRRVADGRQG